MKRHIALLGLIFLLAWQVVALTAGRDQGTVIALVLATFLASILMAVALAWKPAGDHATPESAAASPEDRFLTSLGYLSAGELDIRLGAIHSLDRIRRQSDGDRRSVLDVLSAYVRERSRSAAHRPAADIQAAINILGRPLRHRDAREHPVDLSRADLRRYDLSGLRLERAHFERTRFHRATLTETFLDGAVLTRARLDGADLERASLTSARLREASLASARLRGARLRGADVTGADITNADLRGADLTGVTGLTTAQIASAICDETTRFDKPDQESVDLIHPAESAPAPAEVPPAVQQAPPEARTNGVRTGRQTPVLPLRDEGIFSEDVLMRSSRMRRSLHECPKCSSHDVDRARLSQFAEPLMQKVFNLRSYECLSCGNRFYDRPQSDRS